MKEIIYEYGGAVIGTLGALGIFWILRTPLLSAGGTLSQLIRAWLMMGC